MLKWTRELSALLAVSGFVFCAAAWGQQSPVQTLDRILVNSADTVLQMNFDDPRRLADFAPTGVVGTAFRTCTLTALEGLFCLDGRFVRNWPDVDDPAGFSTAVDCHDPALDFDSKRGAACTALTVESSGTLWIAGRKPKNTHALVRILKRPAGGCPAGAKALAVTSYCAEAVAADIGRLDDISWISGDTAARFGHGKGVLALAGSDSVLFFPETGESPIVLGSGKRYWTLGSKEQLVGVSLLQVAAGEDNIRNLVVATTSTGRILAAGAGSRGREVFSIPTNREPASLQCDFTDAIYGIRASASSGLLYVTDRQYCETIALRPVMKASGELSHLINSVEAVFDQNGDPTGIQRNMTLSTADGSASYPPEGPTVAPGISIDLNDCAGFCPLILDAAGNAAASLSNVKLSSQESGLTLFQIRNIPDCRYVPQVCKDQLGSTDLIDDGIVVNLPGNSDGNPAGQLLNLTPLLPLEVREMFNDSTSSGNSLPPMYMAGQYRGQKAAGFTMDAFFGVTRDGVTFEGVFDGEFDVAALSGTELGCELGLPTATPVENLLQWDTVTTVSESYIGIDGRHIDTLTNTDCGSSRTLQKRWSIVPYKTEIAPCTYNADPDGVWTSDGSCPVGGPEVADDAVFAKLVLSLYEDLGKALNQLACNDVDGAGASPLSGSSCATLSANWVNGRDKLEKCWNATRQPKQSAGDQNCQAFLTQLTGFSNTLAKAPSFGADPANRKGELRVRIEVLFHVYHERFVPSLSAAGFCEPDNPGC